MLQSLLTMRLQAVMVADVYVVVVILDAVSAGHLPTKTSQNPATVDTKWLPFREEEQQEYMMHLG